MATYNKILDFAEQQVLAIHDWDTHVFKIVLSNSATVNTNTILANITQISNGNGYTTGGTTCTISSVSETSGTAKVVAADVTFTASGGSMGPFRYATLYNDTATSPADALICWFDYGSSITLADTETFTVDFNASTGLFTLA